MATPSRRLISGLYWLVGGLAGLQLVAIYLVVNYAGESLKRDGTLLERTGAMMEEIFPGIRNDLSEVSQKATEIRKDVSGLKNQVSRVDEKVSEVAEGVSGVNRQVEVIDRSLAGFFGDKSGLIWGHSVNPYLLLSILAAIACSIPAFVWVFSRKQATKPPDVYQRPLPSDAFASRLDRLSGLVDRMLAEERHCPDTDPQLVRLMQETERLIHDTRKELAQLSGVNQSTQEEDRPENLN